MTSFDRSQRALERAIVVALVLHVGVFAVVRWMPIPRSCPSADPAPPEDAWSDAISVTIDESTSNAPRTQGTASSSPSSSEVSPSPVGSPRASTPGTVEASAPRSSVTAGAANDATKSERAADPASTNEVSQVTFGGSSQGVVDPTGRGASTGPLLGLGVNNPFLARGALPPPPPEPKEETPKSLSLAERTARATERLKVSLRNAEREREHELGLGPEGPVLSALQSATTATRTPVNGRAVFFASADHTGLVTNLKVLECDGASDGWLEAARFAMDALRSKKIRLPSYAKLAEMTIEITSGWKMPNGHDPGTNVTAMQVPVTRGVQGKNGTTMDILNVKIDRVRLNKDLEIPVPATRVDVVATNGDASNLGAKPGRIVHTRLLDVKIL